MPRVSAAGADRPAISRPAAKPSRARAKKIAVPQDRLTTRKLFWRRVKRSLKPGLWIFGIGSVVIIASELVRSLPAAAPAPVVRTTHSSFGLAQLAADFGLRINNVEILGAPAADMPAISQAIGVQNGEPSLGFSLGAVRQRVEAVGAVQTATVERQLPGTLIVNVTERNAFAIYQTGAAANPQFVLIDKSGNIIANQDAAAAKRREPWLLLLSGPGAPQTAATLMAELQAQPALFSHVAAAERVDQLRWNLILKNQTVVKLPAQGETDAMAQLASLQASMQLLDRPVEVIDLRLDGRLVVRPYPAAGEKS